MKARAFELLRSRHRNEQAFNFVLDLFAPPVPDAPKYSPGRYAKRGHFVFTCKICGVKREDGTAGHQRMCKADVKPECRKEYYRRIRAKYYRREKKRKAPRVIEAEAATIEEKKPVPPFPY